MGLTSALFSGLTGMKTNEFRMDVIGNNIANVNTYSFKASRATFQNQFLHTFSFGSAPNGTIGGGNPMQIGTGSMIGSVDRDFSEGAPETTGGKSDLAIQGEGLFILEKPNGAQVYSRDGSFRLNGLNQLLSSDGFFLQGYGVDNDFNIIEGNLQNLTIPIGEITTAAATSTASFSGVLNAGQTPPPVAASRPLLTSQALFSDVGAATDATAATALISLYESDGAGGGLKLFEVGNEITLAAASKGGANLEQETFVVGDGGVTLDGDGSTLQELMDWLQDVLGINTSADLPDLTALGVAAPGVTLDTTTAGNVFLSVVGNIGEDNDIDLGTGSIMASQGTGASGPGSTLPFRFDSATVEATLGESIRTSFRAYDSLGVPLDVNITLVMEEAGNSGITWRYFAESADDSDVDRVLGTGTIEFDSLGQYVDGDDLTITIDRDGTGASTPQAITLSFSDMFCFNSTASMSLLSQDGFQSGTLQDYSIGADGYIVGSFTNGLTRTLGQVVLATFRNYEGLVAEADNLYMSGPNSGDAIVKQPQELGAGSISSGALELSNVDLSREFINLIITSTGYSASSRVIQTSDQLLNELMTLIR